jgi:amino acid transporter
MKLRELIFGRPLGSKDEVSERIGSAQGVPILGLDALSSAAYGPEAAMTVLLLAGARSSAVIVPIMATVSAVLAILSWSYRQTIAAYPNGGGSYTVARENLGSVAGLFAAAALTVDYVLNVAVGVSAGVGALVSAIPSLMPLTLTLCLAIVGLLTLINLRGVHSAARALAFPTYLFLGSLAVCIGWGMVKTLLAHGRPSAALALPAHAATPNAVGTWLVLRSFASGCTALTGVEAVSNAVPLFREPRVVLARRTLTLIVATLIGLLVSVAGLARAFRIEATPPGHAGYQSILSQVVQASAGRGPLYYVTMAAIVMVLCLSANTSFADLPRVWRLLALDQYVPLAFAHRGRRLVFGRGIVLLAIVSSVLLVIFRGITDNLIPLFAVGAFLAFTLSQLGMVAHWRRRPAGETGRRRSQLVNGVGAAATGTTLVILAAAKLRSGAWITLLLIPLLVSAFLLFRRRLNRIEAVTATEEPLDVRPQPPIVVVLIRRLDRIARAGLALAASMSNDVRAVHVRTGDADEPDLAARWSDLVEQPLADSGRKPPRLVVVRSPYRELFEPLLEHVHHLARSDPDRQVVVVLPELFERRWWQNILGSHRATVMREVLIARGGPGIVVASAPWYLERARRRRRAAT